MIRRADFEDPAQQKLYARYLQGWAAGLEYGKQNPRAATQIVMMQFPGARGARNRSHKGAGLRGREVVAPSYYLCRIAELARTKAGTSSPPCGLASQMNPSVATESMMQLANVFAGRMDERKQWGYHLRSSWELFFETAKKVGQITKTIKFDDVCKNDLIDEANAFDKAKVHADAQGFALSPDYQSVDVKAIQAAL